MRNSFMRPVFNSVKAVFLVGSSVRCPAMGADHPSPPECHDNQQRWRMPSSAEPRGRTESTAKDEQPMGGSSNR